MNVNLENLAIILDYLGKILIVFAVLLVHLKLRKEKKVDKLIKKEIRMEEILTILGIVFLTVALIIHLSI